MAPNPNLQQTPAGFLKSLSIIHLALIAGQVLFAVLALVQSKKIMINVRDTQDPLVFVVPIVAISGFVLSNILFKNRLKSMGEANSLKEKLVKFQSALITRFALLEGPSLFGIVAFLITGELFFLVISVFIIIYFVYIKPSKDNIEEALELTYAEKEAFNQPDKVLY